MIFRDGCRLNMILGPRPACALENEMPAALLGQDLEIDPAFALASSTSSLQSSVGSRAAPRLESHQSSAPLVSYTTNAMPSNRATELLMSRAPAMSLSFSCPRPSSSRPEPH